MAMRTNSLRGGGVVMSGGGGLCLLDQPGFITLLEGMGGGVSQIGPRELPQPLVSPQSAVLVLNSYTAPPLS